MNLYSIRKDAQKNGLKIDSRASVELDELEQARKNLRNLQERGQDAIGSNALKFVESL